MKKLWVAALVFFQGLLIIVSVKVLASVLATVVGGPVTVVPKP